LVVEVTAEGKPMAMIEIKCPECKARFRVDDIHIGKRTRCKHCDIKFIISRPEKTEDSVASSTRPIISPQNETIKAAEVTVKQENNKAAAMTVPIPNAAGQDSNIAKTIAAPAEKDTAGIRKQEQEVSVEWKEGQTILDLYEVKKVHTGGGMGLVYRVHHKNWNMDLAVKSPRADYFKTEEQKQNFIKECETWINLGLHPNIVSCYYVRTLGGIPRVFAEYIEGGSLKDWIESKKLYEGGKEKALERILDIAIQFAWGLHYAHEHEEKIVHQDIKPANVMMTEDGEAKVTDFGLAKARAVSEKLASDSHKSILVSSGGMTPAYCSPEQANKQALSRKTDIWSWGLSVLEMFAREVFWKAGQVAPEALEGYLEMGTANESIPKMPDGLVELLRSCFQRNPDDRPKDMQEIAVKLIDIYKETVGREHSRPEPKAAVLLADGLNNKAVSMLDLGRKEEAEKLYNEALEIDPHHTEATYNRGLLLWRSGRMADDELVRQLEEVRTTHQDDWRDEYLLGLVHLERGDAESATQVLEEAIRQAKDNQQVISAIQTAHAACGERRDCVLETENEVASVSVSANGRLALSSEVLRGTKRTQVRLWNLSSDSIFEKERLVKDWVATKDVLFLVERTEREKERCERIFDGCSGPVCISADGKIGLCVSSDESVLQLLELFSGECLRTVTRHPSSSSSCEFEKHMENSAANDGARREEIYFSLVCMSANGRLGLSVSSREVFLYKTSFRKENWFCLWDLITGECLRALEVPKHSIGSVSMSADGRWAFSGI
jgi:predicted Zn finger-like uncharacterized protein